jgi:hypothetical protein
MAKRKPVAYTRYIKAMLMLASETDMQEGKHWYQRAYDLSVRLMHVYDGVTLGQVVGVIAALSPNNKWERNCRDAESIIKAWHAGADPKLVKVCTFNKNKEKALQILSLTNPESMSEDIQTILNGRKVVAFYRCIMGFKDTVCVDGHAYAIWLGERVPTTQTPSIGKALYETITRAYVNTAAMSHELCGEHLTPAQVQAVTWVTYRRLLGY